MPRKLTTPRRALPRLTAPGDLVRWATLLVARLESEPLVTSAGIVVRSPNGQVVKRIGIDDAGAIVVTDI